MKLEWEVDSAVDCNYLLYKHVVLSETNQGKQQAAMTT